MSGFWRLAAFVLALLVPASGAHAQVDAATTGSSIAGGKPTPYVIGGIRLDLTRLTPAATAVRPGGSLVVGSAYHAATATLGRPMRITSSIPNDVVPAGAVLHRVEFALPGPNGTNTITTWCGTMGRTNVFGRPAPLICFIEGDPTHRAFAPISTQAWLNTSMTVSRYSAGYADHLDLEVSNEDLIGVMDIRFDLVRFNRRQMTVRLVASRDQQGIVVMTMTRPLIDGRATIPLWDHRLELTVTADGVVPSILDGGDGFGPGEFGVYP